MDVRKEIRLWQATYLSVKHVVKVAVVLGFELFFLLACVLSTVLCI